MPRQFQAQIRATPDSRARCPSSRQRTPGSPWRTRHETFVRRSAPTSTTPFTVPLAVSPVPSRDGRRTTLSSPALPPPRSGAHTTVPHPAVTRAPASRARPPDRITRRITRRIRDIISLVTEIIGVIMSDTAPVAEVTTSSRKPRTTRPTAMHQAQRGTARAHAIATHRRRRNDSARPGLSPVVSPLTGLVTPRHQYPCHRPQTVDLAPPLRSCSRHLPVTKVGDRSLDGEPGRSAVSCPDAARGRAAAAIPRHGQLRLRVAEEVT